MSTNANNISPLYKRIIVFVVGMPGYLLTFVPWAVVVTLVFVLSISYSSDRTLTIPVTDVQFRSSSNTLTDTVVLLVFSCVMWVVIAWVTKHILLRLARLFSESEKTWQIVKLTALLLGWTVILLVGGFFLVDLTLRSSLGGLGLVVVGVASLCLEYFLGKHWLSN